MDEKPQLDDQLANSSTAPANPSTALIDAFRKVNIGTVQPKGLLSLPNELLLQIISEVARYKPSHTSPFTGEPIPADATRTFNGRSFKRRLLDLQSLAISCSRLYHLTRIEFFYTEETFELAFGQCHASVLERFVEFNSLPAWFTEPCPIDSQRWTRELLVVSYRYYASGLASLENCFATIKWYYNFHERRGTVHTAVDTTQLPCEDCSLSEFNRLRWPLSEAFPLVRTFTKEVEKMRMISLIEELMKDHVRMPGEDLFDEYFDETLDRHGYRNQGLLLRNYECGGSVCHDRYAVLSEVMLDDFPPSTLKLLLDNYLYEGIRIRSHLKFQELTGESTEEWEGLQRVGVEKLYPDTFAANGCCVCQALRFQKKLDEFSQKLAILDEYEVIAESEQELFEERRRRVVRILAQLNSKNRWSYWFQKLP